jgi:hypothetical protein
MGDLRAVACDPRYQGHIILVSTVSTTCSVVATEFSPFGRLLLAVIGSIAFAVLLLIADSFAFRRVQVSKREAVQVRTLCIATSVVWLIAFAYFNFA